VSAPVRWQELPRARPDQFTVENTPARLRKLRRDPWDEIASVQQTLTKALHALEKGLTA
jgi:bifunctional non-homologous end joining protein LigD